MKKTVNQIKSNKIRVSSLLKKYQSSKNGCLISERQNRTLKVGYSSMQKNETKVVQFDIHLQFYLKLLDNNVSYF